MDSRFDRLEEILLGKAAPKYYSNDYAQEDDEEVEDAL
jgi:hypothetical protein